MHNTNFVRKNFRDGDMYTVVIKASVFSLYMLEMLLVICPSCKNGVEDEIHVFAQCQRYNDLRVPFFHKLSILLK